MDLGLYVITASIPEMGRDHYDVAAAAIEGGATAIQLRVKRRPMGETLKIAYAIHELTSEAGIPLIINDHVGIAMAVKAEGLHIGPDDITIAAARRMLGDSVMIGCSANKHDEALKAEKNGADYVGLGAIYETASKPGKEVVGPSRITKVKAVLSIPVIAIGGITKERIRPCIDAGADGVAVISEIARAEDMVAVTAELRKALDTARTMKKQAART